MKRIVQQIQAAKKTRTSLKRSLANPRNNSGASTPRESPKQKGNGKKMSKKEDHRIVKHKAKKENSGREHKKGEYSETLQSFLKLKQREGDKYSDVVMNALEATDNIFAIKRDRDKVGKENKASKVGQTGKDTHSRRKSTDNRYEAKQAIDTLIEEVKRNNRKGKDNVIDTLVSTMEKVSLRDEEDNCSNQAITTKETEELLTRLTQGGRTGPKTDRVIQALQQLDGSPEDKPQNKVTTMRPPRKTS